MAHRYAPIPQVLQSLGDVGFLNVRQMVNKADLYFGDSYYHLDGPMSEEWRSGDSIWSLASPQELERGLELYVSFRQAWMTYPGQLR